MHDSESNSPICGPFSCDCRRSSVLGVGRTTVYRLVSHDPDFPRPVKLGGRSVAFRLTEIEARAAARQPVERSAVPSR